MGILLYFVAILLFIPLTLINLFVVLWKFRNKRSFLKNIDAFFREMAIDIDRFGNRNFRTLWNASLKSESGYNFGNEQETISSVLGKNQQDKTLSKAGKVLAQILDTLDKNHCKSSINNEAPNPKGEKEVI